MMLCRASWPLPVEPIEASLLYIVDAMCRRIDGELALSDDLEKVRAALPAERQRRHEAEARGQAQQCRPTGLAGRRAWQARQSSGLVPRSVAALELVHLDAASASITAPRQSLPLDMAASSR